MSKKNPEINEAMDPAETVETPLPAEGIQEEMNSAEAVVEPPEEDDSGDVDEQFDVEVVAPENPAEDAEETPRRGRRERAERSTVERPSRQARAEARERQEARDQANTVNESALISAIHSNRIFSDVVASVEVIGRGETRDVAAIVLLEKAFKVIIPYSELFDPSPVDPAEFNNLESNSDRNRFLNRKRVFAQRMIGGDIPFCLTAYEMDGENMVLLGSRVRAMSALRRATFTGARPRYKVGDVVTTKITSVNNSSLVVHIGGMDVVIRQRQLTRRFLLDLHDGYKVGQELRAVLTEVKLKENGDVASIGLNPVAVELADARERYLMLPDNSRAKGIITSVRNRTTPEGRTVRNMYAYLPDWDLYARIVRMDANAFGRDIKVGTNVMLRVIRDGHSPDGYLLCHAEYDFGNNGMFSSGIYR